MENSESLPNANMRSAHWLRYRTLYLLIVVCVAPVLASYLAYYVFPPTGRTNYGELVEPQRAAPALALKQLDGAAFDISSLRGQWVMLQVDGGECGPRCQTKLYDMRQVRLTTGKDRDRVERVWLIPDDAPLPIMVMREYEGTLFLRASGAELRAFLASPDADANLQDHIWIIDPLGNLMMRFPKDADPNRMKRDLAKLLNVSRIG